MKPNATLMDASNMPTGMTIEERYITADQISAALEVAEADIETAMMEEDQEA